MTVWWSFKIFFGCASDSLPIFGYRRKSYVLIGWSFAIIMILIAIMLGQPSKGDAAWPYIVCFSMVNFGYIVGDVAMDGQ
jgi:hypothetical protein